MTPERWERIEALCHEALALPLEERAAFLSKAYDGDDGLKREVESLLAEESHVAGFMSVPAAAAARVGRGISGTLVGQQIGSYAIRSLLGIGGMGEVYRAHDSRLGREVAIKVLPIRFTADPERQARFEREARMLATLNHPHIGAIYGVEDANDTRALVLELVEGETLAERIARSMAETNCGLPLAEAIAIGRQIADALDAAHTKGIVHRDLKPANVKITPDGVVKVLDFGLAKMPSEDRTPAELPESRVGVILGTAAYMSPEQTRGQTIDKRSDIWAFGCVLYQMLTGQVAFPGETASDTIVKILEHEPDWSLLPAATPAAVRQLLARCLTKDPKQRLRDIGDVGIEINAIESTPKDEVAPSARQPRSRRPLIAAAAVASGLALMAMGWVAGRSAMDPSVPLRLSATLAPDVPLAAFNLQFGDATAVSPDGRAIAFVGQKANQRPQLYLRRLDELHATPLDGTEGALNPFFSPDGGWIGFFAGQQLKKVAVGGGAVVTLSSAPNPRGGAWSEDDFIVFSPDQVPGTRLLRVPSSGGTASLLAPLVADGTVELSPEFLPGGKAVLYTAGAIAGAFNDASLVVQMMEGGARKVVHRGGYHGRYLRSGHLVYIHDGTLFAVAFDVDRLEVKGQPVPVVPGVRSNAITGGAQFAASANGMLVYVPGSSIGAGARIDWMDAQATTRALRAWPSNWLTPQFSPDGHRLAMEIREGSSDIWTYEWARDILTRVTFDPVRAAKPVWAPDGSRIVFASPRADKGAANLYWQLSDGTGSAERLTKSTNTQAATSWHPSGKFLLFEETTPETNVDLMILPLDGDAASGWRPGKPVVFANSPVIEAEGMFSPDGRWIAYSSRESGRLEVYVRPFPGPGEKQQISTSGGELPTWSRAKNELFFGLNGQIMVAAFSVVGGAFRPEPPRRWSDGRYQTRGANRMFDLHPDGERFALASVDRVAGSPEGQAVFVINFYDQLTKAFAR